MHISMKWFVYVSASLKTECRLANFNAFPTDGAAMPPKAKRV